MPIKKSHNPLRSLKKILSILLVFGIGVLFGSFLQRRLQCNQNKNVVFERRIGEYNRLTNPLLECEQFVSNDKNLQLIKYKLTDYIAEETHEKKAVDISVYLRDLNNGPWLGIKEKEDFSPASLLKVPIMMCYFKIAETNPEVLNRKIQYERVLSNMPQDIIPKKTIQIGNVYTIEELIYRMIVYSDNEAATLLLFDIDQDDLDKVYRDLHITIPGLRVKEDFLSVKDYASFFRILYNASYLNRQMSEKALEILTQTDFSDGILAGLPSGIKVAHKFGERRDPYDLVQLHECAIVYYNRSPYLLAVMARGYDVDRLKDIIRGISKIVYECYEDKEQNGN